jgi:hypothetical protein
MFTPATAFCRSSRPWSFKSTAFQYNQNLLTKAWGFWETVPMRCAETWQGDYYFGSDDGVVYQYSGVLDGATIAEPTSSGSAITFRCLTGFNGLGDHGGYKQIGHCRVVALQGGDDTVSYNLRIVYDYNIQTIISEAGGDPNADASNWDAGVWDTAIWGGDIQGFSAVEGTSGIGRAFAVAMRGSAASRLTLIGWDVTAVKGGFL